MSENKKTPLCERIVFSLRKNWFISVALKIGNWKKKQNCWDKKRIPINCVIKCIHWHSINASGRVFLVQICYTNSTDEITSCKRLNPSSYRYVLLKKSNNLMFILDEQGDQNRFKINNVLSNQFWKNNSMIQTWRYDLMNKSVFSRIVVSCVCVFVVCKGAWRNVNQRRQNRKLQLKI